MYNSDTSVEFLKYMYRGKRTEFAEFAPRNGKRDLNLMEKTSAILLKKTIVLNLLVQNELLMINSTRFNRWAT